MVRLWLLAGALLPVLPMLPASAQEPSDEADRKLDRSIIAVALGGSTVVALDRAASRVTLTDPSVADVSSVGGGLLVIGRKVGETNLILTGSGPTSTYLVKVSLPDRAIQAELARMFPREDIEARAVGGALVLMGSVGSAPIVAEAEQVATGYLQSPSIAALGLQPHVINLLRVRGPQQVLLEVKFAEVSRRSLRQMGLNAVAGDKDGRVGVAVGRRGAQDADPRPVNPPPARSVLSGAPGQPSQTFNINDDTMGAVFLGKPDGSFPFAATLNLLATRDLSKTLAQPNLISMSGQKATFLAGGEFPYEKASGFSTTVQFKSFGVELGFTPTVLDDGAIQLRTATSVSAPDPTLTIVVNGVTTQGFKRRASETTIRLRDGQSFAIAGLLSDEIENLLQKVPGLGDLPILGILFSSKSFNRRETELIIVVTAHLVHPQDEDAVPPLPGEYKVNDPSDVELFLLNMSDPDASTRSQERPARPQIRPDANSRRPAGRIGFWR